MKVAVVVALLLSFLTACTEGSGTETATERECVPQIRLKETTYVGAGYTEVRGTRFDTAVEAVCDDVGPSSRGSEFTEDSKQVAVWSLPGYSTDDVVAARFDEDSFAIFVADSMPRSEIDRVTSELSPSRG
ncbi:MAG TPA: DUF6281 family protein [Nocardioidaceae bacterium]|nr:DUF6281 family protein [Nocardioidaceae bacterium]